MTNPHCRWGILGTANIARKNWKAIKNSGNSRLVAVASRNRDRAQEFIAACQAAVPFAPSPVACGSYDELLGRDDIDAVYVPLPTGLRKEWVLRAAAAGKHVLCEKPCGVTAADVREMIEACRENQVQFMDGVMFMHSSRLPSMRETLDDGESVGTIKRIATHFTFRASPEFSQKNIRVSGELEPLGCLGDLGWYNIRFVLWAMNYALPERVSGRLLASAARADSSAAVPIEFSGELLYAEGVSASFYCSFTTEHQQWAHVGGTQGSLLVSDFVVPYYGCEVSYQVTNAFLNVQDCDFNMEDHTRRVAVREYGNGFQPSQESNMMRHFAEIVATRRLEPQWGDISLRTQQVLEACLESATHDGKLVSLS